MPQRPSAPLPFLLIAVLAGVLVALAVLQLRWIGQWSTVEETRQQRALAAAGDALNAAVSEPLHDAADAFREVDADDDRAPEALAHRLWQWQADAALPSLLVGVYWVEPGPTPLLHILEVETEPTLRPIAWPEAWAAWQAYFAGQPGHLNVPPGTAATIRISDADVPASPPGLALPALPLPGLAPLPVRFVFLPVDADVLQTALLAPTLDRLLDAEAYDVLITGGASKPLYTSDPARDTLSTPDLDRPLGPGTLTDLGVTLESSGTGLTEFVDLSAFQARDAGGPWRLQVQHQAGSIGKAVARLRYGQLGLAFGVLLVLAAATALLVRSAQTQSRLAQRQLDFVAGVSHELRTPLAVLRSAGENLADGVVADPEGTRRYGALVRDESDRLGHLVEGVLALAGADTRARTPQRLDLDAVVADAVVQAQPVYDETGTTLAVEVADNLPPLDGDAAGLATALSNLLVNAARHGTGSVRLAMNVVTHADRQAIAFEVRDEGPGLAAVDIPHLFDPFYRGAAAPKHAGAGLGLALVRRVAETHGGTATARNGREGGAVFTLTLPTAA